MFKNSKAATRIATLDLDTNNLTVKVENGQPIRVHSIYAITTNLTNGVLVKIQDNDSNDIIILDPWLGLLDGTRPTSNFSIDIPFIASNGIQAVKEASSGTSHVSVTVFYDPIGY